MGSKVVFVAGAGTMGQGIAQVCAQAGCEVHLSDVSQEFVAKGMSSIESALAKLVSKGKMTEADSRTLLGRIHGAPGIAAASGADIIVEAIIERIEAKSALFKELDRICPAHTIFGSNTSSLSITEMAAATSRPEKFIGIHFFNPAPVMKLVEIIRGLQTSDETTRAAEEFARSLGKETSTSRDFPGFVTSRMVAVVVNEGFKMVMEGLSTPEDIDKGIRLGLNHPMGPLELGDLIGLDVCVAILRRLHDGLGDQRYAPCPLLVNYVAAGRLGRKSGRGVYEYPAK
jgi:3-hydroxybutyryl-CoA dehydrogenase